MPFELARWLLINMIGAMGLNAVATQTRLFPAIRNTDRFPWRDVTIATIMAIYCMLLPWNPQPGIQIDLRNVVLGLVAWTHGPVTALPVAVAVLVVRALLGGPGVVPAVASALFTVLLAFFFTGRPRTAVRVALFGTLQTAGTIVAFQLFLAPLPDWAHPGSPVWLTMALVYLAAYYLLGLSHDLARETTQLREVLAHELRSKEALLELVPYTILILDNAGRATGLNQAGRHFLETTGLPALITEHPDISRALREGRRLSGCRVAIPQGERESILLVSAVPVTGGAVLGIQNVTNVVQQERQAAQRARMELLGHLAAMAAHEIKNPLTTIKGFIQLLGRKPEFSAHQSTFTLVMGEVEQINHVVSDFLLLSGQDSKRPGSVSVDDLLHEVLDVMRLRHIQAPVELVLEGEAGLVLWADRKSVTQVLMNLVLNAFEAMPEGGTLTLRREWAGSLVRVTVADTGAGISPEMLPHIFHPYMTTKETGTGLGLAISHKLATDMGGMLEVASEVGKGSRFRLLLPAAPLLGGEQ